MKESQHQYWIKCVDRYNSRFFQFVQHCLMFHLMLNIHLSKLHINSTEKKIKGLALLVFFTFYTVS